ncbi:MAG: DUF2188 domain-containing protein [Bacteroidaceae bacterium]|nr:DUF2188 domain-containing protein [Bacteroidaceae bacterium]
MSIHVIHSQGEWKVRKEGASRALRVFADKQAAINFGQKIRRTGNATLYVHRKDGTIRYAET